MRRQVWLFGAGAIVTSVAIASILPNRIETIVPAAASLSSIAHSLNILEAGQTPVETAIESVLDILKTAGGIVDNGDTDHIEAAVAFRPPAGNGPSRAGFPLNGSARALNQIVIPGLDLAIRTSMGELHELLYGPPPSSHLLLTHLTPPYTVSGPGNFEMRLAYVAGGIERSLFEAGQQAGLSDPLILRLAEIFGWDIDFALDVRAGDSFGVVYEEKYWLGRKISEGLILAAEFLNGGRLYRAIGFRGADGEISYYTPSGRNLKRAFLRTPVKFSRVSSRFSHSRYHPVLKLWRAHTGVDYAAPEGTPVRATAAGRVTSAGWNGGYGNTVVISHGGSYSTLYAHLSRYPPGLRAGRRLEQGDVIGYVGKTGLATGPHLHYEFQVNGQHKNPLTFDFPNGEPVPTDIREDFLRLAAEWVTRLDLISGRHIAQAVASDK